MMTIENTLSFIKEYLDTNNYIKVRNANFAHVRFTDKDLIMYFAIFAKNIQCSCFELYFWKINESHF